MEWILRGISTDRCVEDVKLNSCVVPPDICGNSNPVWMQWPERSSYAKTKSHLIRAPTKVLEAIFRAHIPPEKVVSESILKETG